MDKMGRVWYLIKVVENIRCGGWVEIAVYVYESECVYAIYKESI